jgi:hypothetical protein
MGDRRSNVRKRALRVLRETSRRAHGRTYPRRAVGVARNWQYPDGAERLVPAPVFLLGPPRSGSTALRKMLDAHSRICAPPELHLSNWRVETNSKVAQAALEAAGLSPEELANLLWDRVMHLELVKARKSIIVDKTPRNTLQWKRIAAVWPEARFLILLRHPMRVAESLASAHPQIPEAKHRAELERYALALHDAQHQAKHALTVRYEDLVSDPGATTRRIAEWLGIRWEETMLNGSADATLVAQPEPSPNEVPDELRKACELLGYL